MRLPLLCGSRLGGGRPSRGRRAAARRRRRDVCEWRARRLRPRARVASERLALAAGGARSRARAPRARAVRVPPLRQRRGRGRDAHDLPRLIASAEALAPSLRRPNVLLVARGRSQIKGRPPRGLYRDHFFALDFALAVTLQTKLSRLRMSRRGPRSQGGVMPPSFGTSRAERRRAREERGITRLLGALGSRCARRVAEMEISSTTTGHAQVRAQNSLRLLVVSHKSLWATRAPHPAHAHLLRPQAPPTGRGAQPWPSVPLTQLSTLAPSARRALVAHPPPAPDLRRLLVRRRAATVAGSAAAAYARPLPARAGAKLAADPPRRTDYTPLRSPASFPRAPTSTTPLPMSMTCFSRRVRRSCLGAHRSPPAAVVRRARTRTV